MWATVVDISSSIYHILYAFSDHRLVCESVTLFDGGLHI